MYRGQVTLLLCLKLNSEEVSVAEWLNQVPEDIEAERSLLATCAGSGAREIAADVISTLNEDDFIVPKHRIIFKALRTLVQNQIEISAITLKDVIDQNGELNLCEGFIGITELLASPEVGEPSVLADLLRRKTKLRKLIKISAQMGQLAGIDEKDPELLIEEIAGELYRLKESSDLRRKGLMSTEQVSERVFERIHKRLKTKGYLGVPTGFPSVDDVTQGFQEGNLIVLAARPGVGKTSLALNWILRSAQVHSTKGAFFSLEMSHEEVFLRLLSSLTKINMKDIQAGRINNDQLDQLYAGRDTLVTLPIYVCDQASITVPQIEAMILKHQSSNNQRLDFVIIDYLQLISSPESSRGSRQNEAIRIGEISRGLKLIAKNYQIPIIVLSQLNREVEHRTGGKPQLSDLRDSGAIEQDADIVAFIHRRMNPSPESNQPDNHAELLIAKHRNGPTANLPLIFQPDHATYYALDRTTDGLDSLS